MGKGRRAGESVLLRDLIREAIGLEELLWEWGVLQEDPEQDWKDRTNSDPQPIEPTNLTGLTLKKLDSESGYKQLVVTALENHGGHLEPAAEEIAEKTGKGCSGRTLRRHVYALGLEKMLAPPGRDPEYDVGEDRPKSDTEKERELGADGLPKKKGKGFLKGKKTKTNPTGS